MNLALVRLSSPIHNENKIQRTSRPYLERLNKEFQLTEIKPEEVGATDFGNYDLTAVFVQTGGTENRFQEIYHDLPDSVCLITTSLHNSLPAALEILTWVKYVDGTGKIVHGDPDSIVSQLNGIMAVESTIRSISNGRMGVIGEPSDWLIASEVNYRLVTDMWGLEFIDIDVSELYEKMKLIKSDTASEKAEELASAAIGVVENTREDLTKAVKVYLGLVKIAKEHNLTSLTLRCFDLVSELNTTGCLGLSLLNSRGIIAGCEGDVPATFTMLAGNLLTGKLGFMANPVKIDPNRDRVVLAHCTVPTKMAEKFTLRSHFESGIGVGIQGHLKPGPVTLVKIGGKNLTEAFVQRGGIVENLSLDTACRTQIAVKFDKAVSNYLLEDPIANHHVVIRGDHVEAFKELMKRVPGLSRSLREET